MPIDMVRVETTMSITRNGRVIRKPISKPRRISEIMKAGTRIRRSTVVRSVDFKVVFGQILEESQILVADLREHEVTKRLRNGSKGLLLGDLVVQQRLQTTCPSAVEGRGHDVKCHEERQTDQDEIGRRGLQAKARPQERERDGEAGEARDHHKQTPARSTGPSAGQRVG